MFKDGLYCDLYCKLQFNAVHLKDIYETKTKYTFIGVGCPHEYTVNRLSYRGLETKSPLLKKKNKLGFEMAGSWLTSKDQLHTQQGLSSSSLV